MKHGQVNKNQIKKAFLLLEPSAQVQQEFKSGTLGLRLFISFLLFAAFVAMDYKKDEFMSVNSSEIIQMISEDTSAFPILEHR